MGAIERAIDAAVDGLASAVALALSAVLWGLCRIATTGVVLLLVTSILNESEGMAFFVVAALVDVARFSLRRTCEAPRVLGLPVLSFGVVMTAVAVGTGLSLFPVPDSPGLPVLNSKVPVMSAIEAAGGAGLVWATSTAAMIMLLGLALRTASICSPWLREHIERTPERLGVVQAASGILLYFLLLTTAVGAVRVGAAPHGLPADGWKTEALLRLALGYGAAGALILHVWHVLNRMEARRDARQAARTGVSPSALLLAPVPALQSPEPPRQEWHSFQAADAAQELRQFIGPARLDAAARVASPLLARVLWAALWLLCRCMATVVAAIMQWPVVHDGSPMLLAAAGVDVLRFLVRRSTWRPVLLGVPVVTFGVAVAYVALADGTSLLPLPSGGTPLLNPASRTLAIVEAGGAGEITWALSHALSIMAVGLLLCASGERIRWMWRNHQRVNEPLPLSLIARGHAAFAFLLLLLVMATHTTIIIDDSVENLDSIVARGSWPFRFMLDGLIWQLTFAAFLTLFSWVILNLMAHQEEARRQAAAARATPVH